MPYEYLFDSDRQNLLKCYSYLSETLITCWLHFPWPLGSRRLYFLIWNLFSKPTIILPLITISREYSMITARIMLLWTLLDNLHQPAFLLMGSVIFCSRFSLWSLRNYIALYVPILLIINCSLLLTVHRSVFIKQTNGAICRNYCKTVDVVEW